VSVSLTAVLIYRAVDSAVPPICPLCLPLHLLPLTHILVYCLSLSTLSFSCELNLTELNV